MYINSDKLAKDLILSNIPLKEKLQKEYKSVYAEGSQLFENQYKYNVQEKTKLYPIYKTQKDQEEVRKAEIRKGIIFNGIVDENEVQQLYKQTYRDENLKNVTNWKSFIGDKLFEAFSIPLQRLSHSPT
mgnify:CR=1 FL=1